MSNLSCAEATCLWLTENFADCHATLQKIESETKADNKLAHNLLVVEHVLAGSTDADRVSSQLGLLANERLAADEASGTDVVAASSRSRSSGVLEALPLVPVRDDLAVAQLNRAILLYQRHRYAAAAELLEPLASNAEALAEGTAVRVLTLLLDIYIEGRQLPRAVAVLHTLERLYSTLTEAYGTGGPQTQGPSSGSSSAGAGGGPCCGWRPPRTLELPRVSRWGSGAMVRSRQLLEQQGRPPAVPDLKLLIRLYRSRLHALAHNTRAAKRELQAVIAALTGPGGNTAATAQVAAAAGQPAVDGQAGGDAGGSSGAGSEGQARPGSPAASSLLVAVRAQLELYRGRVRKATKLLLGLMQDASFAGSYRPLLLNNLGLVHHQQGKHTLALLYLSQALAASSSSSSPSPSSSSTKPAVASAPTALASPPAATSAASASTSSVGPGSGRQQHPQQRPTAAALGVPAPAVMYNAGLQHLLLGNFEAARGCFATAAVQYSNTPLLWLRTAEAALGLYRRSHEAQQQPPDSSASTNPNHVATAQSVLANGPIRSPHQPAPAPSQVQRPTVSAAAPGPVGQDRAAGSGAWTSGSSDAASLLSEAITALQTALQQLDAQQDEHEQWQSSSNKLDEGGVALPSTAPTASVAPATAHEATVSGARAEAATSHGLEAEPPAEPCTSLPPTGLLQQQQQVLVHAQQADTQANTLHGQQQANHQQHPSEQQQVQAQALFGAQGGGATASEGADRTAGAAVGPSAVALVGGHLHQMENGVPEHHGTDASAALAEELRAVRLAVLANLSYAHLQAGDWPSALAAARALMDAAAAAPAPTTTTTAAVAVPGPASQLPGMEGPGLTAAAAAATGPGARGSTAEGSPTAAAAAPATPVGSSSSAESYSFLAATYMAEALCHLDRPGDAVECLSLWLTAGQEREAGAAASTAGAASRQGQQGQAAARTTGCTKPDEETTRSSSNGGQLSASAASASASSAGGRDEVYPLGNAAALAALTGPAAVATTYTNLASVFASQGELAQAAGLVRQALALQPSSAPALLLLVFCELSAGNTEAALGLLKWGPQM